jgi:hypothetical protein
MPASVSAPPTAGPRGEYSIPSARGIAVDVISGSIDVKSARPRRRTTAPPAVSLVSATKREVVVRVRDQVLTLDRHDALTLAAVLTTAFD